MGMEEIFVEKIGDCSYLFSRVVSGLRKTCLCRTCICRPRPLDQPLRPREHCQPLKPRSGNLPSLKLSARIDPMKIYQGEFFDYMVELGWEKARGNCEMEFKLPEVPKAEGVQGHRLGIRIRHRAQGRNENVKRIYKFQYYPEKTGKTTIAQADFEYRCRGTEPYAKVSAPPFPVEIYPRRFHLADLKGNNKFYGFLGAILVLAILSAAIMIIRDRKRKAGSQARGGGREKRGRKSAGAA